MWSNIINSYFSPAPAPPERLTKGAEEKDSEMEDQKKTKLYVCFPFLKML